MFETTARVPTVNGSRYLQQLCKHWSHNLTVAFTPDSGTVVFPKDARGADWPGDATLTLKAEKDTLECRLEASAEAQREAVEGRRLKPISTASPFAKRRSSSTGRMRRFDPSQPLLHKPEFTRCRARCDTRMMV